MQTFSIAVGDYNGFSFKVNPHNTAIVEFAYTAPYAEPGEIDKETGKAGPTDTRKDHNIIAEFHRNGNLIGETRIPVESANELRRDVYTGRPRRATEAELNSEEEIRLEREQKLEDDKAAADTKARKLSDSRAKRVEKAPEVVVQHTNGHDQQVLNAAPEVQFDHERGVPAGR